MAASRITAEDAVAVFAALSQETRLEAYRLLLRYQPFGLAAGDIARLMAVPHNTLSTHLSVLQKAGLVRSRRESRSIIFAAFPERFAAAQAFLGQGLASSSKKRPIARPQPIYPIKRPEDNVSDKTFNVLVLCTGNSARSILAEAILNREGHGRFMAYSAGSQPKGKPHAVGIELLQSLGYDTTALRSKSWTEFAEVGAPKMDFIITVCDSAAGESCPYWPGHPLVAHWGIPDPADVAGTAEQKRAAFQVAYRRLMSRVTALLNLPIDKMGLSELKAQLAEIGKMDGATELALTGKGRVMNRDARTTDVVIYHNPACGTSRKTLALIRNAGVEPHIVEHLKTPPGRELLVRLVKRMGVPLKSILRESGTPFAELQLGREGVSDDELLAAITEHPILINRPIVVTPWGVKLCRPSEAVLDILPLPQNGPFVKEDGEALIDADGQRVK